MSSPDGKQLLIVQDAGLARTVAMVFHDDEGIEPMPWPGESLTGRKVVLWPASNEEGEAAARRAHDAGAKSIKVIYAPPDDPRPRETAHAIISYAKEHVEEWVPERRPRPTAAPELAVANQRDHGNVVPFREPQPVADADTDTSPMLSEDALALRFTALHGEDWRFTAAFGKWSYWEAGRWKHDETLLAFSLARKVCRAAARDSLSAIGASQGQQRNFASAKITAAVERLARSDRRHAAKVDQWDTDPWLLNTPGGTVDLRTGEYRGHRREDHITKITGVAPDPACPTPVWESFLHRISGGDPDLVAFLKRMSGYAATGDTREHALFFCYGTGGNGKGTFLNALTDAIGDYAKTAPIETFTATAGERHPTELAGLRGARLVTAQETEEGRRWAESRIKALTGGDRIAARFMRQDFFEFMPQFKLVIAGNHKPGLRAVDEAIRRRFHLVPFTVTITREERDEALPEKLKAEAPGILQWMIDGTAEWLERGLAPPPAVTAATEAYLESEDATAAWLEECCEEASGACEATGELFKSWKDWAEGAGEYAGSAKRFSQNLESRGFIPDRQNRVRVFRGIRLVRHVSAPLPY